MKNTIAILGVFLLFLNLLIPVNKVFGQTSTPKPTNQEEIDTIERIKDLVASKVAELDLVERRGILGTVKNTTNTQISLTDYMGNVRNIDIDELTEFESDDDDDFGISDIENGTELAIVGLYNKDNERLLARFITVVNNVPLNIDGKISEIDDEEFTITMIDANGNEWLIDIETSTDTFIYEDGITDDSGFTAFEIGQRAIVIGFENIDDNKRMSASRIIHFAKIPPNIDETQNKTSKSGEVEKSTGDAGNVEPITAN